MAAPHYVFAFTLLIFSIYSAAEGAVSNKCIRCICQGTSKCDLERKCTVSSRGTKICGPFWLTKNYWLDAGKPLKKDDASESDDAAFEACATDGVCSVKTVIKYMEKYQKDCDGDNTVTCWDYGLIHGYGPTGCKDSSKRTNAYYKRFQECHTESKIED